MLKTLISLLVVMTLAGCATTEATIAPSAAASLHNNPEHGAVAFRLTVSGPEVGSWFEFWTNLTVASVEPGKEDSKYQVGLSRLGAIGSASYFGSLPPGHYRIEALSSRSCGAMCLTTAASFREKSPVFEVSKGKITYLGNVLYVEAGDKSGLLFHPEGKDSDNFRQWLATYYPAWAGVPLKIEPRRDAAGAERSYRAVQAMTIGNLNGVATPGGTVLFNNYSGSLRQVSWPAGVRTIQTGLLSRGNTVLPLSDQHWIAAGDFGEARMTLDGGKTWRDAGLNLPYGAVRALYKGKDRDLLVLIEQESALDLYSGTAGGPWTRLSSSPFSWSKMKGGIARPAIAALDDRTRVLVAIPSGKSYVLDTGTYARSEFELPGAAINVGFSADGVLRCRCNKTGLWVSTWESRDEGKTWQDSKLSRTLPLPHYVTTSTAFNTNGFNLTRSVDGGKTWKQTFAQKEAYWPFLMQPYEMRFIPAGGQRIVATDTLDKLMTSEDNGATWQDVAEAK